MLNKSLEMLLNFWASDSISKTITSYLAEPFGVRCDVWDIMDAA
jgi:hypothetical protein